MKKKEIERKYWEAQAHIDSLERELASLKDHWVRLSKIALIQSETLTELAEVLVGGSNMAEREIEDGIRSLSA